MSSRFNGRSGQGAADWVSLLQEQAQARADMDVLHFLREGEERTESLSFARLDQRARMVAGALQACTQPGDRVMLLYLPGLEFIQAYFGCLYAGRVAVPLPPPRPARMRESLERILGITASAEPAAVLTSRSVVNAAQEHLDELPQLGRLQWLISEELDAAAALDWQRPALDADSIAFLQYTSGSTALPKGVILTHGNLLANADYFIQGCGHGPDSSLLNWLPPFHDLGLIYGLLTPVRAAIPGYVMPNAAFIQKPSRWVEAVSRWRITHTMGPNFAYGLATAKVTDAQLERLDLSCWEQALNGAEPVRMDTLRAFHRRFAPAGLRANVLNPSWGLAEASCIVTSTHEGFVGQRPVAEGVWVDARALETQRVELCEPAAAGAVWLAASGYPIADTELAIVEPTSMRRCALQEVGEVLVRNKAVGKGYWGMEAASREIYQAQIADDDDGRCWMRTGDLGFMHEGQVVITGRIKDVVIIRGRNHYPQDIEWTAENAHPLIRAAGAAAFSLPVEGDEALCVVVEVDRHFRADRDGPAVVDALRQAVSEHHELKLAAVAMVRQATLPKTTSGKIQRRATRTGFVECGLNELHRWVSRSLAEALAEGPALQSDGSLARQATRPADDVPERLQAILAWLCNRVAVRAELPLAQIAPDMEFARWGLDSQDAVAISGEVAEQFKLRRVPETLLFDRPTPRQVAAQVLAWLDAQGQTPATEAPESAALSPVPHAAEDALAIVGMAGCFPGAANVDELWQVIVEGRCTVGEPAAARRYRLPRDAAADAVGSLRGGWLEQVDQFDPAFFHVSPLEAESMDPRQRLALMEVWHALETARISREELAGSRTGVFVGASGQEYGNWALVNGAARHAATGGANSIIANRVSYYLDLHGPSLTVDTACSSSLAAFHLACQSLRAGECDTAIVIGVNLLLDPRLTRSLQHAGVLSASGACHSFDQAGDGYVRGEGVAVVVLRHGAVARRHRNPVRAWVAASASNQDGRSFGLSAPSGAAQARLIAAALRQAGLSGAQIDYVEAHGTGTALGDPIEWEALAENLDAGRRQACAVGSIKANIGHLEAAAGLTGVIKSVLCLGHAMVPPVAGLAMPNPRLRATPALELPTHASRRSLRHAAVSSMGFGGTNVHVILQRGDVAIPAEVQQHRRWWPIVVSAATETARDTLLRAVVDATADDAAVVRLSRLGAQGRSALPHRAVLLADGRQRSPDRVPDVHTGQIEARPLRIAVVFAGQGSQRAGMGSDLYRDNDAFRAAFDTVARAFSAHGCPVHEWLLGPGGLSDEELRTARHAQPAVFAFNYAAARMLQAGGVELAMVAGHSLGEYVAACVAGVLELDAAVRLVAERSRLMATCQGRGTMYALKGDAAQVQALCAALPVGVELAACNAPGVVTLAGDSQALAAFGAHCVAQGSSVSVLPLEAGFHSSQMDPILPRFTRVCEQVVMGESSIPFYANLDGEVFGAREPGYWVRHLREPVQFQRIVEQVLQAGADLVVEVAAIPTLAPLVARTAAQRKVPVMSLCSLAGDEGADAMALLARLYCRGVAVNWLAMTGVEPDPFATFPAYPFDLQSIWLTQPQADSSMPSMTVSFSATSAPVQRWLLEQLSELLRTEPQALNPQASFLEAGADSLVMTELLGRIKAQLGVSIEIAQLFDSLDTPAKLAAWLESRSALVAPGPAAAVLAAEPPVAALPAAPVPSKAVIPAVRPAPGTAAAGATDAQQLMSLQLSALRDVIRMQLDALGPLAAENVAVVAAPASAQALAGLPAPLARQPASSIQAGNLGQAGTLDERQRAHVDRLVHDYVSRTRSSRDYAVDYRSVFSDYRSSLGFRRSTKPMTYPLVVETASGSHLTDLDGHDYVDLTMAFGSALFGHNPPMVLDAIQQQLVRGIQVGPKSPLSGRAARLVSELTGCERVAFANSGTEAVMTALRLARAVTGRELIVRFTGAYHGHSDNTLVKSGRDDTRGQPIAPGVLTVVAQSAHVLEWGAEASLEQLQVLADQAAAILVEPVQSRRPGVQPAEFLKRVRAIADASGAALVFDEIITGFRLAPGGAQSYFGVRADLVTYGKVAGGGMPIGIIAGSARFMDAIDGSAWSYDDDSAPHQPHTFFAGTFSAHPLTMASTIATLERIRHEGQGLYDRLAQGTADMVRRVNSHYEQHRFPIRIEHAGSLFRFVFFGNYSVEFQPIEASLFMYHMTLRGVYVWEGHTCFLSAAHTSQDIDRIVSAAIESAHAMAAGGFFPVADQNPAGGADAEAAALSDRHDAAIEAASAAMNAVALQAFAAALLTLGWQDRQAPGKTSLLEALGVTLRHAPMLGRMLEQLAAGGVIEKVDGRWHALRSFGSLAQELDHSLAQLHAHVDPDIVLLLTRCAQALPAVLCGKQEALETLFGGEASDWLGKLYAAAPGAAETTQCLVDAVLATPGQPDQPLRILEVGAGTGAVARRLLSQCGPRQIEFWFTDVSPAFLARAERELADDRVRYVRFDVEFSPLAQNLPSRHFDVVVAGNVLHATAHRGQSLGNMSQLLRPGGRLLLLECTTAHPWLDMVFGITEGWWRADSEQGPAHPLLAADEWLSKLRAHGFEQDQVLACRGGLSVLCGVQDRRAVLPLSRAQQQILVHLQTSADVAPAYSESVLLEIEGSLDVAALSQAWGEVLGRHAMLRSHLADGGTGLVTAPAASFVLETVDFRSLGVQAPMRMLEWMGGARMRTAFDPERGPLINAWLLLVGERQASLFVMAHHLIIDGLSYGRLLEELWECYRARQEGQSPRLRAVLSPERACAMLDQVDPQALEFWRQRLRELPPPLDLPVTGKRPMVQTYDAGRVQLRLPQERLVQLRKLGAALQATPFMTLMSVWRLLLSRLAGTRRLVIGVPVSVHPESAAESYVGFAVNVLPLVAPLDPTSSFASLVGAVRDEMTAALEHRHVSFAEIVRVAGVERDASRPVLVQALFNCESHDHWSGAGIRTRTCIPPAPYTKYELTLDVLLDHDGMDLVLTYNRDLFKEAVARSMLERFDVVLKRLIQTPEVQLSTFDVLTDVEREQLGMNPPMPMLEQCLHRLCEQQAERTPDSVAVRCGIEQLTFRELDARANRLAQVLLAHGVQREERIAVCLPRTFALPAALLGVMKAGAAYVPIDPVYPPAHQRAILEQSGARLLIVEEGHPELMDAGVQVLALNALKSDLEAATTLRPEIEVAPDQLAYVIFTSGSTGVPKGVAIEHRTVCSFLAWAAAEFPHEERAGVLASTSMCFDLSVFEMFLPLAHGGSMILVDSVLDLLQGEQGEDITLVNTVPSAAVELLRAQMMPPSTRVLNLAGEALPEPLVEQLRETWPRLTVCNLYGPTEDTTYSTWLRINPGVKASISIGKPLPGTRLYLLDEDLLPVPDGARGEIFLAGNGLARGYLNLPTMTAERFLPDPFVAEPGARMYRTGDIGRLKKSGVVEYLGRIDDQVKIRGHRIELGAIDALMRKTDGVVGAAVLAQGDPLQLTAFYSADSQRQTEAVERDMRERLARKLPRYMMPAIFRRVEQMPLTPNGKIDRKTLGSMSDGSCGSATAQVPGPRNQIEQELRGLYASLLKRPEQQVGVDQDFFALGGNSLLAMRLLHELNAEWDADLKFSDLMLAPSVAELALRLTMVLANDADDLDAAIADITQSSDHAKQG